MSTGAHRSAKSAKQQAKEEDPRTTAAAVPVPQAAAPALPLRIEPFSRDSGDEEQSSSDSGAAAPSEAAADAGQAATPRANPPAPGHPSPSPAGDLAFAARVQPAAPASAAPADSARPLQPETAAPAQVSAKKITESDGADPTMVKAVDAGAGASLTSYGHASAHSEVPLPPPDAPSTPPKPVEAGALQPQPQPKPAAAPLKDISMQVSQPGAQKVEVRVVQQSGELRVAVRTGDSDLAHGLQQGLSDLVGRLQENGFRAEAWRPGGSTVQSTPVLESRNSQGSSQNGDARPDSGGSQQQEGQRRQNQPPQPGWVDELEKSIGGGEQFQGATYGIGS
jgi:hypothetical protein